MLAVGIVGGLQQFNPQTNNKEGSAVSFSESPHYNSLVQVYKTPANTGKPELVWYGHNLITNIGKEMIQNSVGLVTGTLATNATFQVLGNNSAPVVGDTTLNGLISNCGLAGKGGAYTENTVSSGNWTISSTWTSTCNNEVVNSTGLYNMSSAGQLFAGTTFTSTTLQVNDQITTNYTVWIS